MLSIQLLSPDRLWDILDFCPVHADREETWFPGDVERYRQGQHRRAGFLARKMDEGARLQVAYRDGVAVGFVEYYPIEITNLELAGQDVLAIWCILVRDERQGIGSALLQACLDDARAMGRKGVAVTCWDPVWMGRAIFERAGFVEVGPAGTSGAVLFRPFTANAEPPRWVGRKPAMELVEGKVAVDVFHTDRCPIHWRNTALVREVAQAFGDAILWREHWTDRREDMLHYGTAYSIYANGKLIAAGPPVKRERVRQAILETLLA
ncbi:MAG: GNAT family N-acetyltransferase [Anaerolineae bacterium]